MKLKFAAIGATLAAAILLSVQSNAAPVVFWAPDSLEPGNVVLLYGGGLAQAKTASVWRLPDDAPAQPDPTAPAPSAPASAEEQSGIQPADYSVKFVLPGSLKPGVFAAQIKGANGETKPVVLNRPQLWFMQPTKLKPGLNENQAVPGDTIQIIGKDFLLPGELGTPRAAMRLQGGAWMELPVKAERFSLIAQLPPILPPGRGEIWVHNGYGGTAGWGGPLAIEIKPADQWPGKIFDVKKDFGAKGDDVTDDTAAIQQALAAARQNGGGIVYLPWGIYRLSSGIIIPPKTVLRGESRDATVLMWPVDEPKALTEFTQAAIFGQAPYAVEDLSIIARKVNALLEDTSFGQGVPPELKRDPVTGGVRDIFLRRVNLQHWIVAGRGPGTALGNKYGMDAVGVFLLGGARNFEMTDCQCQGGSIQIRNIINGRETGNQFGNEMGYCWTAMGGGAHYVISQGNEIRASSSWGYGAIGMKYVYSAHNKTWNFVRGEREAMTLDISALPASGRGGNIAWFGNPTAVNGLDLTLTGVKGDPNAFAGMAVMILDGPGVGQYRVVKNNTDTTFTIDKPWDVPPDSTSTIGLWSLMRHMIVYKCDAWDTSAFAQLYGSFYDYIVDSCHVERNQGIWGQSGWFVQFRYNDVWYANTYHPGIGPGGGPTPEKTMPYSFVGLTSGVLRVTKFGSAQYGKQMVMVDEVTGHPIAGVHGAIVKGNSLKYNQRVAFPPTARANANPGKPVRMFDVIVDGNRIEHSPVGIQIGGEVRGAVVSGDHYEDVATPYDFAMPETVDLLENRPVAGN